MSEGNRQNEDTFEKQVNLYFILIVTRGDSSNKTFLVAFHNKLFDVFKRF